MIKILKHVVISDEETLSLFNKAKSKLIDIHPLDNINDKKTLKLVLKNFIDGKNE